MIIIDDQGDVVKLCKNFDLKINEIECMHGTDTVYCNM